MFTDTSPRFGYSVQYVTLVQREEVVYRTKDVIREVQVPHTVTEVEYVDVPYPVQRYREVPKFLDTGLKQVRPEG